MLIKKTKSLCPACNAVIPAKIVEEEGKIWIKRTCPDHGEFRDIYWSDPAMYHRYDQYAVIGDGIENPQNPVVEDACPTACGLCSNHHSQTLLANIDLTNRCNLNCDFCFANARACGFIYEPSFDDVVRMLTLLRSERPIPTPAVQFSGGEPTLREDLVAIIKKAKALGFPQVQIATNGVRISEEPDFVKELKESGLNTIYLHFDGVSPVTNPFLKRHQKAIENLKNVRLGCVLVPTIIKGRNDHELGDIIRFAAENISVVRGVNFQPVSFTGAASDEDIKKSRITIPEVCERIENQTGGIIRKDDFYPIPCVLPFSDLVEAYTGKPQVRFTSHQHCGAATYVFVTKDGIVPVNRMVDVDRLFESIEDISETLKQGGTINKYKALIDGVRNLHESFRQGGQDNAAEFWKLIGKTLVSQNFDALREFHWNALFIGTMHFMDRYNYDIDRVQRCCIHYATPEGRLVPFCTYNSGPVYREKVWKKFAQPLPE
ncbi:MAG TPA: radical SAM protein [Methanoregulaceae archaeon]|nr:radical SAM protein [Methanoregulaceae archaeon]